MIENPRAAFSQVNYVFLDRDGVINRKPPPGDYVRRPEDLHLLPGVEPAVARLNDAGYKVLVVTNQRGIALGLYSADDLAEIHTKLRDLLSAHGAHLDGIYVCPHENGQCSCRKPLTGLFEQAFHDFPDATIKNTVMVGDSLRDIEAGTRMGMPTVLVDSEPKDKANDRASGLAQLTVSSLAEFVEWLLVSDAAHC